MCGDTICSEIYPHCRCVVNVVVSRLHPCIKFIDNEHTVPVIEPYIGHVANYERIVVLPIYVDRKECIL